MGPPPPGGVTTGDIGVEVARPALAAVPIGLAGLALESLARGCCCLALVPLVGGCWLVGVAGGAPCRGAAGAEGVGDRLGRMVVLL